MYCSCGAKNDVNHALTCKLGGYIIFRHNAIRDAEAELLKEICRDVRTEPELLPIHTEGIVSANNIAEKARLDVSAVGLWSPFERTFMDVRVCHPNAPSYRQKSLPQIYKEHENQKKRQYNDRVVHIEKGTFSPLVFFYSWRDGPRM